MTELSSNLYLPVPVPSSSGTVVSFYVGQARGLSSSTIWRKVEVIRLVILGRSQGMEELRAPKSWKEDSLLRRMLESLDVQVQLRLLASRSNRHEGEAIDASGLAAHASMQPSK